MIPFLNFGGIAPHSTKRVVELGEEYVMYSGGRPGAMTNTVMLFRTYALTRNFSILVQSTPSDRELRANDVYKEKTVFTQNV